MAVPAPYNLLLAGLGACTSITLKMYADRKGWTIEPLRVSLTLHKDNDGNTFIARRLSSDAALDGEQWEKLIEIAGKTPVTKTLMAGATITTTRPRKPAMRKVLAVHEADPPHWVGDGFPVRSIFSYDGLGREPLSPFLMLDYAAPRHFEPGDAAPWRRRASASRIRDRHDRLRRASSSIATPRATAGASARATCSG